MSEHHCRICEIFDAIEDSDNPDNAHETYLKETMDGLMERLFEDDVYLFLDEKYRKQVIEDMPEQEYQNLLSKIKEKSHLKLVVSRESDRTLN